MYLETLTLKNYRNYAALGVRFTDGVNILQGRNAAGKTNVLEAIGMLSYGKSFRTQKDTECIKDGAETAYIRGGIVTKGGALSIEALLSAAGKKSLKVNGQPVRRMGELFGNFIAVVFSPEDLKTLKESPSLRRRFADMEISKLHPSYFFELQAYSQALAQKNALLKSRIPEGQLKKLVTIYNEQLATHGERIIKARQEFLGRLAEVSREVHRELSGGEVLELKYRCSASGPDIRQSLFDKMDKSLSSEIEQGFCLHGPHREDFSVSLDGAEIRTYSSQGQIRTAMLSIKLATFDIAKTDFGESPVLLLDDVFSELDEGRQAALLNRARGAQCFITTAVPVKSTAGAVYTVANGAVTTALESR